MSLFVLCIYIFLCGSFKYFYKILFSTFSLPVSRILWLISKKLTEKIQLTKHIMYPSAMLVCRSNRLEGFCENIFENFLKLHKKATVVHYFFSRAVGVQPAKLLEGRQFITGKKILRVFS